MKQIFIVYGEPAVGKSTLFRKAVKADFFDDYTDYMFCKEKPRSIVIDGVVPEDGQISNILKFIMNKSKVDYLTIITSHNLQLLIDLLTERLKPLNIPISICEMRRV